MVLEKYGASYLLNIYFCSIDIKLNFFIIDDHEVKFD